MIMRTKNITKIYNIIASKEMFSVSFKEVKKMKYKLINCPFCGSNAEIIKELKDEINGGNLYAWFVMCRNCKTRTKEVIDKAERDDSGIRLKVDGRSDAIAMWNKRYTEDSKEVKEHRLMDIEELYNSIGEKVIIYVIYGDVPRLYTLTECAKIFGYYYFVFVRQNERNGTDTITFLSTDYGKTWNSYKYVQFVTTGIS